MEEPNGLTKGHQARVSNEKATMPSRRSHGTTGTNSRRSWLFNTIARILTWYAIITILFRCPSTLDECDDTSPVLCKAYFNTRDVIVPHVEPYYDAYAAPYVDRARPYVDTVSTKVVAPTRVVLERYAAPKLHQAKEFAQARWATTGQPQVDKAREFVTEKYDQQVAPHVERLAEAVGPYRDVAQASATETYHDVILPSYELVKPYAVSAYDAGCTVTTETIVPSVVYAFNKTYTFLDGNVWPHLKAVYVQNVEPQLVRIGERLGRYNESGNNGTAKKSVPPSHSTPDAEPSSFVKPSESVQPSQATEERKASTRSSTSTSETVSKADASASSSSASQSDVEEHKKNVPEKPSQEEVRRIAAETVADDLYQWETKFANAAEEGASDIEAKVDELSASMFKSGVRGEGQKLMQELESVAEGEFEKLQQEIISLVESSTDTDAAKEAAAAAVRSAGLVIKDKAEGIRSWREKFERDLQATVTANAQEHFNILGNMRDLALQKIGMKWAWMDGITYKHWAKYHDMKHKFNQWTQELQELIVTNPSLEKAMNGAADVEDRAMEIAQGAAVRLGQLKQVAHWKIDAGDATDSFDADEMERAAEAAQAAAASTEPVEESQNAAEEKVEAVADAESEPVTSDSSFTEDGEEIHADTAPEEEPQEVPELGPEDEAVGANEDVEAPEPAEAEPDLNEEIHAAERVEDPSISESPAADEDPAFEDVPASDSAGVETEPSIEPAFVENGAEALINDQGEEAPLADEPTDDTPAVEAEQESETPNAAAESVVPEDIPSAASEAIKSASSVAESVYSDAVSEASAQLSSAVSAVPEQVDATPDLDPDAVISSASSAFDASVESASSRLGSAVEEVQSMESVMAGEAESGMAEEEPVAKEEVTAVADEKEAAQEEAADTEAEDESLLWSDDAAAQGTDSRDEL